MWFKRCCNYNLLKIIKNWAARHFWKWLIFIKSSDNGLSQLSLSISKACKGMACWNDSIRIRTHKRLVHKRILNHWSVVSLAKLSSVRLQANCLWVRIPLLSLKLRMSRLFLDIPATAECRFMSVDSTRTWHDNNIQYGTLGSQKMF